MNNISSHKIVHFDDAEGFTLDIDSTTAKMLMQNFNNEITAMHLIQSGDIKALEEFMGNNGSDIILGYSNTRFGNERAFAQRVLALSSIAAVNGGVDCTTVYALIFKYQNIIEKTNDSYQLISLSYDILKKFCSTVHFGKYQNCQSPILVPVLRYIHSNLHTRITLENIADKFNMNANYLCQLFKKQTGERFSEYVLKTKIITAKHLMETTDKAIWEISEYLAFSSPSHFNNVFKKITGTTPKQYLLKVKKL